MASERPLRLIDAVRVELERPTDPQALDALSLRLVECAEGVRGQQRLSTRLYVHGELVATTRTAEQVAAERVAGYLVALGAVLQALAKVRAARRALEQVESQLWTESEGALLRDAGRLMRCVEQAAPAPGEVLTAARADRLGRDW